MGAVTSIADAQVDQIRRELHEYDLKRSSCPVDRRRAEKEAEQRAHNAREAQEQQSRSNLMAAVERRIGQWFSYYFTGCDIDNEDAEDGHRFGIYTATLTEMLADDRMKDRKWAQQQIEHERRNFEARIAELEARLKAVPGKLPVAKTWQPESVTYQAEMVSHKNSLYQARKDTAQEPGRGADWVCVARHGRDAVTPTVRGNSDAHECYAQLDVVEFDGACDFQSDVLGAVVAKLGMELRAEFKCAIEHRSLVAKEDFDKNTDVFEAKIKAAIATCERAAAEMLQHTGCDRAGSRQACSTGDGEYSPASGWRKG